MANSRFEYVKEFEKENYLLPETYIVVRVDGRGFHRFSDHYGFKKPNDDRALGVINDAAMAIVKTMPDVMMAYGDSDEYSFLLKKDCQLFERREAKLVSTFASTFTAYYIQLWSKHFDNKPLDMSRLPTFDARCVLYPTIKSVRDYFSWRQADCHINNLYNTTFWNLVLGGLTPQQAEEELRGSASSDKHEILFSKFSINYNNEPEIYKKGTIIVREMEGEEVPKEPLTQRQMQRLMKKNKMWISQLHVDIIKDTFWNDRPWLLS